MANGRARPARGGPAFYIARGLKANWAAPLFAITLTLSFGRVFNTVQANAIASAVQSALGVAPAPLSRRGLAVPPGFRLIRIALE